MEALLTMGKTLPKSASPHEIGAIICDVFNCKLDEISKVEALKKGMTNDSFIFSVGSERYVFRVPGRGTDALINRKQEHDVYAAIKELAISDEILYFNEKSGHKISRYYEDSQSLESENVLKAMSLLRKFHSKAIKVSHQFDIWERIEYYLTLCQNNSTPQFPGFEVVYQRIIKVNDFLSQSKKDYILCHVDAVIDNFLVTSGGNLKLLDWEYAGMADYRIDIAMHAIYSGYSQSGIEELASLYYGFKPTEEDMIIIYAYVALSGFLWSLWTCYKEGQGDDFGDYGSEQFEYADRYSSLVIQHVVRETNEER
ncbi:phosphotransferase family protein [Erysipelothrix sp. HDW6C]|uniref:choline/ethanolamine kinase family protein n=1 Tax=Erysipelothrix sp. HDW6C TaxID=2714930 RepID=UPI00140E080A|nr:choline/ethanolamine kinase family protein [Erysipelothrix sp. HDW6C]QIK70046.1 phosphotransferase family protein [Erysipelothrix sp. HDW6C]